MKPTRFIQDVKGYALSAALLAAMDQNLFELLAHEPMTAEEICREQGWDPMVGRTVLDVLEANGYLSSSQGVLTLTESATPVMSSYAELRSWAKEMSLTFSSVADLTETLRTGDVTRTPLSQFWSYKSGRDMDDLANADVAAYSEVMERSQETHAQAVLSVLDLTPYQDVLEVGGGYGGFARHALKKAPHLTITVADLPAVAEEGRSRARDADEGRIRFHGCDALKDPLPQADAVIFNRVLHDWADSQAIILLRQARAALRPGGKVIAAEHLDDESVSLTPSSAATRLMLTMMGGKRRTESEMRSLFDGAGLQVTEVVPTGHSLTTVLVSEEARPSPA